MKHVNDISNIFLKLYCWIFISSAAPVNLPEPGMTFQNGDLMKVSGWGALSSNGQHSEELRMVTIPFVSDAGMHYVWFSQFYWHFEILNRKTGY